MRRNKLLRLIAYAVVALGLHIGNLFGQTGSCPAGYQPSQYTRESSGATHIVSCVNPASGAYWLTGQMSGAGGQAYNVLDYGAIGNGATDDTAAFNTAIGKAEVSGGAVFVPPGAYKINSGLSITGPARIQCAGGGRTILDFSGIGGATAISLAPSNAPFANAAWTAVEGCTLYGPGSTVSGSIGIALGNSTLITANVRIVDATIGNHSTPADGFATGIEEIHSSNGVAFQTWVENPDIEEDGIGIIMGGETSHIMGGTVAGCTHSLVLAPGEASEASVFGTSFDSDSGAYIVNNGVLTISGAHFETNKAGLASNGFISNSGQLILLGGAMLDDARSGTGGAFVTTVSGSAAFVSAIGTDVWTGGQRIAAIVSGPSSSGSLSGLLEFHNLRQDSSTPQFDGTRPHQLTVLPSYGGSAIETFGYSAISLNGVTWKTVSRKPSGSCTTGSIDVDTAGSSGTTLYVCEASAWAAK